MLVVFVYCCLLRCFVSLVRWLVVGFVWWIGGFADLLFADGCDRLFCLVVL